MWIIFTFPQVYWPYLCHFQTTTEPILENFHSKNLVKFCIYIYIFFFFVIYIFYNIWICWVLFLFQENLYCWKILKMTSLKHLSHTSQIWFILGVDNYSDFFQFLRKMSDFFMIAWTFCLLNHLTWVLFKYFIFVRIHSI